jgi:NTP pyrophosphatase (non-canonical NTP hydrolase)
MDIKKLTLEVAKVSKQYSGKFKIKVDGNWYVLKLQDELGELIQSYLMMIGKGRAKGQKKEEIKENFHKEVADVFCQVLLLAKFFNIDLEKEVEEKWLKWNKR